MLRRARARSLLRLPKSWRAFLVLALLLILLSGEPLARPFVQVKGAFHVHTTVSTGALSLDQLVQEAQRKGIDTVIFTENFLLRFEYGLFPFRSLVKKVEEKPSILQMGVAQYLQAVEAAQRQFPDLILIPGAEVIAYGYWTGSLLTRDLTHWDAQKNLLVVGLARPEDYEQLPAIGNGRALAYGRSALVKLVLGLVAIVGGILLLQTKRTRTVRLQHFTAKVQQRYRLPGWMALAVGVLLLVEASTSSALNPYLGPLGIEPHQRVIDFVEARGGMAFWSYPEARDFNRIGVGPVGEVLVRTEPYPELLLQTQGYTGFGGIYQDNITVTEPGHEWDRLLLEYAQGRRARPAWGVGELGYHGPSKQLNDVLTIFLVPERSRAAILTALKEGRLYAVSPLPDYHLVLEDFSLSQPGTTGEVPMGGELHTNGPAALRIRLQISTSDKREVPVTVRLIRSGTMLEMLQGKTPFERTLMVQPPEEGMREFFRIEVTQPHKLLSNPIFVRRRGSATAG